MTATVETPSGKTAADENFPVGSWLIRADLRPHVHVFYRFARTADDIADNPALTPDEKVQRLNRMEAVLLGAPGDDAPDATAMRQSLRETEIAPDNCRDLLIAFRRDATKLRYVDWDDLMDYCRYSAAPVGRQVLDLHRAPPAAKPPSDALCAALQVLNHLQDCALDYTGLDRIYLPERELAACGGTIDDLRAARASTGLRKTIDVLLDGVDRLMTSARRLPAAVPDLRLRAECATIVTLAETLSGRLRREDPVAGRVALSKSDFAAAAGIGFWRMVFPW